MAVNNCSTMKSYAVEILCHQVATVILHLTRGLTHGVSAGVYLFLKRRIAKYL